jgi:TPP-dependent pyruvate/acetoin dehydrogenase alpha subunit
MCVNNGWALSTPTSVQSASETFAIKALAYGMPGVRVDGNDAFAVYAAAEEAIARARRGEGPTLIEAVTYRLSAHSSSDDPTRYRESAEVASWAAKEPLIRLRAWLQRAALLDGTQERALIDEIGDEIRDSIAAEEVVPPPNLETLIEDVYVRPLPALVEQLADLKRVRGRRS